MPKRTKDYHSWLVQKLADPYRAQQYLKEAANDSPEMFLKALRNVAEARGMSKVAEETGLNRESLYRTLSSEGNPEYHTLNSLLLALGIRLTVELRHPRIGEAVGPGVAGTILSAATTPIENQVFMGSLLDFFPVLLSTAGSGFILASSPNARSKGNVGSDAKNQALSLVGMNGQFAQVA